MLRKLELLIPAFMKRIDSRLLLNHPVIWSTQIHFVAFFGVLWTGGLALYALLQPVNPVSVPNPDMAFSLLLIPSGLAFILWVARLSLFSPERQFGEVHTANRLGRQFMLMAGVLIFASAPFVYPAIQSQKIANMAGAEDVQEAFDALNKGRALILEGDYMNQTESLYNQQPDRVYNAISNEEVVRAFKEVYERYSGNSLPATLIDIREQITQNMGVHDAFDAGFDKAWSNLRAIDKVTDGRRPFFSHCDFSAQMSVFVLLLLGFTVLVFARAGWKNFLLAMGAAMAGWIVFGSLTALFLALTRHSHLLSHDIMEAVPFLMFFGLFGFLFSQAYSLKNTRNFNRWKQVSLVLVSLMTVIVPTMTNIFIREVLGFRFSFMNRVMHENQLLFLIGSVFVAWGLWALFFDRRFRELNSTPKQN